MSVRVRRIRADEGEPLRAIRLRALADTPSAFGSTHAREVAFTADVWEDRARVGSAGDAGATFVAVDGDLWLGMASVFPATGAGVEGGAGGAVELMGMWSAPEARRRGVGTRLVEAVVGWASEVGADRVELWVTRGNDAAAALYERLGFEPTGDHQPLPSDPCKDEVRMVRRLHA